ncbi:hypothetical protein Q5425_14955 [Amycolatopsis sp. A133]|uniref:hypothetical protein n=1 Tax=Amycolatopsis sp. A133 TaxID=3064472 RepID=UPI0027FA43EB|nr:hypothetical protein [Amycolatopsis sp. A133]MDQ7805042.1 hypothetical protein [Amycolatopsis sp. A133]
MARRAPRREQVTVAELLVRSDAPRDRYRDEDTVVLPRARHRGEPQVLRSLTRLRMLSVVAGALALTGGVSAAVSMPVQRHAGAAWPPAGLEPPAVALVPLPADVVVPPAKPVPKSVAPPVEPAGITPAVVDPPPDPGRPAAHRATLARAVKIVEKAKAPAKAKPKPTGQVVPVRHEIPDVPLWSRGRPKTPDWATMWTGRRPAGHHECGGGRHRR